jgi:hypothetical protein
MFICLLTLSCNKEKVTFTFKHICVDIPGYSENIFVQDPSVSGETTVIYSNLINNDEIIISVYHDSNYIKRYWDIDFQQTLKSANEMFDNQYYIVLSTKINDDEIEITSLSVIQQEEVDNIYYVILYNQKVIKKTFSSTISLKRKFSNLNFNEIFKWINPHRRIVIRQCA